MIRLIADPDEGLPLSEIGVTHVAAVDGMLRDTYASFQEEKDLDVEALRPRWRAWTRSHEETKHRDETVRVAKRARQAGFKAFLLLGVGGSDLAPRVIHECLNDPWHNDLPRAAIGHALQVYFGGDTFDPRSLCATLAKLKRDKVGRTRVKLLSRTLINVVSRSGKTSETFAALMLARQELGPKWHSQVVATTLGAEDNPLYQMAQRRSRRFFGLLPVPGGVGGRFSAASPVGLLTLAISAKGDPGERVEQALDGFKQGHEQCFDLPPLDPDNTAFRLARWLHLAERYAGKTTLVFYNYADDRYLGDWFTQLYSESIQERGKGLNVIATRGPTGNHSILNGIIGGPRDKVVLFVRWENLECSGAEPAKVPRIGKREQKVLGEELSELGGLPLSAIQDASWRGTAEDLAANGVPNVTLVVPRRDETSLFHLMRVLMDAVAIKGRLQGLHYTDGGEINFEQELTYQQHSVEGYKTRMRTELARIREEQGLDV
jgi:glucose-6-phosphate isomerase